jgi:ADP-ribose pyrophosphatase
LSKEPTIGSERIYTGRVVGLRIDTVALDGGRVTRREIVEHRDAVGVLALDADSNVLLVRQYRKPVERDLMEIPAGGVDPGEDLLAAVRRELQEETGFLPGRVVHLSSFFTTPGFCTETMHLCLATDLQPSRLSADEDEVIETLRVPLSQIPALITSGRIEDAKTLVGLLLLSTGRPQDQPQPPEVGGSGW